MESVSHGIARRSGVTAVLDSPILRADFLGVLMRLSSKALAADVGDGVVTIERSTQPTIGQSPPRARICVIEYDFVLTEVIRDLLADDGFDVSVCNREKTAAHVSLRVSQTW
jgi:hypothetical protein